MLTVVEVEEALEAIETAGKHDYRPESVTRGKRARQQVMAEFSRLRVLGDSAEGLRALLSETVVGHAREQVALEHRIAELEAQLDFQGQEAMKASQHAQDCTATILVTPEQAGQVLAILDAGDLVAEDRWCVAVSRGARA